MDRKGFISAALATPVAGVGVFRDAVQETHELTVGPTDILCFVADPGMGLSLDRIIVTQGLRPYVIKGGGP